MKKIAIFSHSKCGRGDGQRHVRDARRILWGWPLEIYRTSSHEELLDTCKSLNSDEYEAVIVIGGDGTFHHALKTLRSLGARNIPLYPFPAGTANDLASELGLRADWEQVQAHLDQRSVEAIDCLTVNAIPFATIAGLGAGAKLTSEFNARRAKSPFFKTLSHSLGSNLYSVLSARTILFSSDYFHRLHFQSEGFDEKLKSPAVFICNQARLGARMTVAPDAVNNDGRFHVVIVPRVRKHRLLTGMIALHSGIIPQDFIVLSTRELSVKDLDGRNIQVFGDGEALLSAPELKFAIDPKSLLVYSGRAGLLNGLANGLANGLTTRLKIKVPEEAIR